MYYHLQASHWIYIGYIIEHFLDFQFMMETRDKKYITNDTVGVLTVALAYRLHIVALKMMKIDQENVV